MLLSFIHQQQQTASNGSAANPIELCELVKFIRGLIVLLESDTSDKPVWLGCDEAKPREQPNQTRTKYESIPNVGDQEDRSSLELRLSI